MLHRLFVGLILILIAGCYASHGRPGGEDPARFGDDVPGAFDDDRPSSTEVLRGLGGSEEQAGASGAGVQRPPFERIDEVEEGELEEERELEKDEDPPYEVHCIERTLTPVPTTAPVDIVWVVDSSRSMADELARVTSTLNSFVRELEARHVNVHLVMITAENLVPAPLGTDASRYRFISRYVDSQEPLVALVEHYKQYADFLRPDGALHFVVVTDDESDMTADEFATEMGNQVGGLYQFHAVASPNVFGSPCRNEVPSAQCQMYGNDFPGVCGATAPGEQYYALAEATSGEQISVCLNDWDQVFGPLTDAVARPTPIPCVFTVGAREDGEPFDQVSLDFNLENGTQSVPRLNDATECSSTEHGWFAPGGVVGTVQMCPQTCDGLNQAMSDLSIELDCYSIPVPLD